MYKRLFIFSIAFVSAIMMVLLNSVDIGEGLAQDYPTPVAPPQFDTENILEIKILFRGGLEIPTMTPLPLQEAKKITSPLAGDGIYAWSKVAYQSYIDGNYEVMVAMADGSNPQRLTYHPANDGRAKLNRGATKVVFSSNREGDFEIYTMNVDGSSIKQLTFNDVMDAIPSWSPDSNKIAFSSYETGNYEIYVMNADGSERRRITYSGGLNCFDPSWSPDGTEIVYVTWDEYGFGYVWSVPVSGGNPTQITSTKFGFIGHPMWSPDGTKIAFEYSFGGYFTDSIVYASPGSGQFPFVNIEKKTTYEDYYLGGWSPDSQQVIFNRIQYVVVDGRLYVSGAYLETGCADYSCSRSNILLSGTGLDFLPHWETADIDPPTSRLMPSPKYSRIDGFILDWQSQNTGLAPLNGFNLQYQKNQDEWRWWYLENNLTQQEWFALGEPGDILSFRLQAYDEAGNVEPWPTSMNGESQTTLYTYHITGEIADNRGYPLTVPSLNITPSPISQTNSNGYYKTWLKNRDNVELNVQVDGFGTLPTTNRELHTDLIQNFYFPPENNLVVNGNWELGSTQGWEIDTSPITSTMALKASLQNDFRHTGQWALTIGSQCNEPCWTIPETVSSTSGIINSPEASSFGIAVDIDDSGTVYVLAWQLSGLLAYQRSPEGVWSEPTILDPENASSGVKTYLNILPDGEATAIWQSPDGSGVKFATKLPMGTWVLKNDLPEPIESWALLDVVMDDNGGLYVLYRQPFLEGRNLFYCYRTTDGNWQIPVEAVTRGYYDATVDVASLAVSNDHFLHLIWRDLDSHGSSLYYQHSQPDGSVIEKFALIKNGNVNHYYLQTLIDNQNQVHVFFEQGSPVGPTHLIRYSNGSWSAQEHPPQSIGIPNSIVSDGKSFYILGEDENLYWNIPGQEWLQLGTTIGNSYKALEVDKEGNLHLATSAIYFSWNYQTQERAIDASEISISQQVAIPENTYKPTLSFVSQLRGGSEISNSFFDISVQDSISNTVIYTGTMHHTWEHNWAPLNAWAGKDITVTFTLHQDAGDHLISLDLDDISIGAWETPVIHTISPDALTEIEPQQTITITGENFIQKPMVFIAETQIPEADVDWINENTLSILVPVDTPVGIHDIKVINPGGQTTKKFDAFRVGWFIYLPQVRR